MTTITIGRDWLAELRSKYVREVKQCLTDDRIKFAIFLDAEHPAIYRTRFEYEDDATDFPYYAVACANAMELQAHYQADGSITVLMDNGSHVLTWAYPTLGPLNYWNLRHCEGR